MRQNTVQVYIVLTGNQDNANHAKDEMTFKLH